VSNSKRIRPPWWLTYVNKAMIGVQRLGIGFGGKGPVILTVPGRKSGKLRSTPITPMSVDGNRYVLPPDEARPLLRLFPVEVPTGVSFLKNAGLVTGPNPDEYEALAGRCPVFRVDPA
jgi:hypothetical protein